MGDEVKAIRLFIEGYPISEIVDRSGVTVEALHDLVTAEGLACPPLAELIEWEAEERDAG